ncbi:MAG TPA: zf-HC2 domain-containing protein [Rhizomicrobium sp.]|jgi:anti-sigma factor RsiW|nr:zf-HC2 domain-containing protein [Rhizomicrobium sp.]
MSSNDALRMHQYFDRELDASAAAEIERHFESCSDTAALLKALEATRNALRREERNFAGRRTPFGSWIIL